MSHNLFAGGRSYLDIDSTDWLGWWLLKAGLAWNRTMKFDSLTDSSLHECFLCSIKCCLDSILSIAFFSKLESIHSSPAAALWTKSMWYSKSSVVISTIFTASSPGTDSISRHNFHCSSLRSNFASIHVLYEVVALQSHLQAPLPIPVVLLFPQHMQLSPPLKSWTPQSSMRIGIFFQSPVNVDILTSSQKSQILLVVSRMLNPFQRIQLALPRSIRRITIFSS